MHVYDVYHAMTCVLLMGLFSAGFINSDSAGSWTNKQAKTCYTTNLVLHPVNLLGHHGQTHITNYVLLITWLSTRL